MSTLQAEIEARLADAAPDVEVLLADLSGETVRLFIDHPDGVTLGLCERVSSLLTDYRERYSLEVSSPGRDRPLTKPAHFSRFLGRRARVRLRDAKRDDADAVQSGEAGCRADRKSAGRKSLTGELVGASEREVTIAAADGIVSIPYEQIARSNLVPGD